MYEHRTPYHHLKVTDNNGIRLLKFERNRQSSMRLDDPFETDFEYPGYFHIALAFVPEPTSALVIGLGGGTVVKRMWRDYPQLSLDVVELDPEVVDVARCFFALPEDPRIQVFVGDGRDFLETTNSTYDIVIVDAYDDDHVPRSLMTQEFMLEVAARLRPGGVLAYNAIGAVYGAHSRAFRSLYRTAANVWRSIWVFPVGSAENITDVTRNIIFLATDAETSEDALLDAIAGRVGGRVTVPGFDRLGDDLYRGKVRSGDVPILIDHTRRVRHVR